jgi:hypothetical protein
MNVDIIKAYCQFCLKQQTKDHPKIPINRNLKQNFLELTQMKVRTVCFGIRNMDFGLNCSMVFLRIVAEYRALQ